MKKKYELVDNNNKFYTFIEADNITEAQNKLYRIKNYLNMYNNLKLSKNIVRYQK